MNFNTFIKKHSFGEVEKNLLIALIEQSETSYELSQNIADSFNIELTITQVEEIKNSWFAEYSRG